MPPDPVESNPWNHHSGELPAMGRRRHSQVFIDLDDDDYDEECKSKHARTSIRPAVNTSGGSKNDALPQKRSSRHIASSRRDKKIKDKLDTDIFELYLQDLWKCVDEDKKSAYTYFDSLWFSMYNSGNSKSKVLEWIKAKEIFSRRYVFVPIVCWGHWNLLVLCNLSKTNYLGTKQGPRMVLLDSLRTTNPTRMRSAIKRFIVGIFENEEREELKQFINKVDLEYPAVPQQTGDECGIYVLYFIHCFLQNEKLGEDFSQLDAMFDPKGLEKFRKDIHLFRANRNMEIAE